MSETTGSISKFLGAPERAWLKVFLEPLRPMFKEVLLVSLFVNILAVAVPVFVLQVYDRVVFHAGMTTLQGLVIGMVIVIAFDFVLRQTRSKVMQSVALRLDVAVGRQLFEKIMALPLRSLESRPASYWQLLFRDVEAVRNTLSGASAILCADLPFAILFLTVVFLIAWPVAWVLVIVFVIFLVLAWRSGQVVSAAAEEEKTKIISRDGLISEMIMGRSTVKALAMTDHLRPLWEDRQAEAIAQSLVRGTKTDSFVNAGHGLTMFTTVAMTTVGAVAIMNQELTIGGLIAANMLSGRLLGPLNQLVGAWRNFVSFGQSVDRLGAVFGEQDDRAESAIALERPKGRITFEETTFRYGDNTPPVVDAVKLDIAPGGVTAIMGANGSGKTTLLKLLLGLYTPVSGRVLLDGADIKQFSRRDLSHWIGYAPQECVLFNGTVRDNIAQTRPDAADAEIIRASTLAQAHEMLINLPDGYGTQVGEGGSLLSGGMRQRIAIARALLGAPPVIVMDEPSGSLDKDAEANLRHTLSELGKTHTVILVTHSPVLLQACGNVIIMDQGRIRAAGPTRKVMEAMAKARTESESLAKGVPLKVVKVDPPTQEESTGPADQ
ncbi:MAG: ATP-binding cassette domain-containing protein [Rhodospirillaceae bacterium]|jgi:ATP-binding cassette, subfamily C, bacterial LapB|nr:ATP-binding cassette domain-containing protein [Rhodospirillaceae bacterium]MBT5566537.1 ATP-binding cassette domain-containing protein [Rhodospirillaceae bacterium]MBT6089608.1 ATP-binding cassette domain-containing protein [Rhodospirillaceae bacterium]